MERPGRPTDDARQLQPPCSELELLRLITSGSPEMIVLTDADLRCRLVSDRVMSDTGLPPELVLGFELWRLIHRDDHEATRRWIDALTTTPTTAGHTVRIRLADRAWHLLSAQGRRLEINGTEWLLFSVHDVTDAHRSTVALQRRIAMEGLLEAVQRRFIEIAPEEIDDAIRGALAEIGSFVGADRAYVLSYDHATLTESMTHEWHIDGIADELETYQEIPWSVAPEADDRNRRLEISAVPDVLLLDSDSTDRRWFESEGIRSIIEVPFAIDGVAAGELGLDWLDRPSSWSDDELDVLRLFASTFSQIIARQRSHRELTQTLGQLRMVFEESPAALALVGLDGRLVRVNSRFAELHGRTPADIEGLDVFSIIVAADRPRAHRWALALLDRDSTDSECSDASCVEVRIETRSGELRWLQTDARPVVGPAGRIDGFVAQATDVTGRKAAEAALSNSETRFRTLVDNLPDPVIRVATNGAAIFANQAAEELLDDGEGGLALDPVRDPQLVAARLEALLAGRAHRLEHDVPTVHGTRLLETRFIPEVDATGSVTSLLLVATDLTDRRSYESELAHQATHDALTGLPNRSLFMTLLRAELAQLDRNPGALVAVVFLDLDHFKVINDSLGHATGDELLVAVARRLGETVRPGDVISRLGGDEFTLLLRGCRHEEEVAALTERVITALTEPIELRGRSVVTSASAGIACTTNGDESPDEMMRWADAAMYRAKEEGRATLAMVDDDLQREVLHRLDLDEQLRGALDRNEFEVYYQPEVDLNTGRFLGAEALLRWMTVDGMQSATSFIRAAEENGLIMPIGAMVLDRACHQAARWWREDPTRDFVMRVNLSARQLDHSTIVDTVGEALTASGLPASRLCLEITETALMSNAARGVTLLEELDALGVMLAVDDFGTGYSSLSYLKRFPVDVLKIDRAFIEGIPEDGDNLAIVRTILGLADSLGLTVTAEGIETPTQAATLLELGCERGQGFLFGQACTAAQFEVLDRTPVARNHLPAGVHTL